MAKGTRGILRQGDSVQRASVRKSPGREKYSLGEQTGGHVIAPDLLLKSGAVPNPKRAFGVGTGDTGGMGGGDVQFLEPQLRNPLLSPSNFQLPQTSLELNQWMRYFDRFHPTVGNAIDMHSSVPFSRFALMGVADPDILKFYEDMADEMNLLRHIFEIAREYWLMGEAFPFLIWDFEMNAWGDAIVLNPDYVEAHGVMIGGPDQGLRYELVIDHELRQFIMSSDPLDQEIIADLDPAILQAAQGGMNAPLDKFNLTHLARRASPYDVRGTSILLGCIKDLLYDEQLREAMYAIAGGIVRPREIWKIGTQGEWMPSDADLDDFRSLLASSRYDPNFAIVSHYGVTVENVDAQRRILPLKAEWDEIDRRLLTRLFVNKAATTGEGPTYANASVAMTILDARYASMRDWVIQHLKEKVFLPVAMANEFFDKDGNPIIPDFRWLSRVNLKDKQQQISYLMTLHEAGRLPFRTICDSLDLNYEETVTWILRERGTIVDPAVTTAYKAMVQQRLTTELEEAAGGAGMPGIGEPGADIAEGVDDVFDDADDDAASDIRNTQVDEREGKPSDSATKPPKEASDLVAMHRGSRNGDDGYGYLGRRDGIGLKREGAGFRDGNHDALRRSGRRSRSRVRVE